MMAHKLWVVLFLLLLAIPVLADVWWTGTPSFVINETAHYDAGTKTNQGGNYEVESYTDNLQIAQNTIELSNKFSDRFTYADADSNTWKWDYYEDEGFGYCYGEIDNGKLNLTTWADEVVYNFVRLNDVVISGDFDIQVDYSDLAWEDYDIYPSLALGNTNNFWASGYVYVLFRAVTDEDADDTYEHWYWASDFMDENRTEVASSETSGKMRITRDIIDADTCDIYWYYWNATSSSWHQTGYIQEDGDVNWCSSFYVFLGLYNDRTGTSQILYDNFTINSGTLTGSPYREDGEWTSDTITMTGITLLNTTINYTADALRFIDKVEWLNATTLAILATNDTDMTAGGTITYVDTAGTDLDAVTDDFKVKVWLKGNGADSPTIDDIIGFWSASPVITDYEPQNASYCDNELWINATTDIDSDWCGFSYDGETNETMDGSGTEWYYLLTDIADNCTDNVHNVTIYCNNTYGEDYEEIWLWICPCCGGDDSSYSILLLLIAGIFAFLYIKMKDQWMKWLFLGMCLIFILAVLYVSTNLTDVADVATNTEVYMLVMVSVFVAFVFFMFIILLKQVIELWMPKKRSFNEK